MCIYKRRQLREHETKRATLVQNDITILSQMSTLENRAVFYTPRQLAEDSTLGTRVRQE